ncbi:MAG: cytochrome c biogenesis protein [Melioribacteraceae bacterium]|nr:cytochrome c biogenesis protein [Melioribacteraceae bacterium]
MLLPINFLNITLPVIYIFALSVYVYDFYKPKTFLSNSKRVILFISLLIHLLYLVLRMIEFNHPPITNKFEIFSIISFSIAFSYFTLELLTDIRMTGSFILIFSFLFQLISTLFVPESYVVPEILRNRLLGLHVFGAILGYSGLTISAVYGILFLLLYKNLKTNKFGILFERLPSLEILERLNFYSTVIGFVLLSLAIVIGIVWLPEAFPNFNYFDPKLVGTILVWLVYLFVFLKYIFSELSGKRIIIYTLIGYSIAILSLIITNTLAKTFHSFY